MKVYENENCTIEFKEKIKCIIQHWNGFSKTDVFKDAIEHTLQFFQEHNNVDSIISDTRQHRAIKNEDVDWVTHEINPKLIENGLKKMAFIVPESAIAKLSIKKFSNDKQAELKMQHFASLEVAEKWIEQQ